MLGTIRNLNTDKSFGFITTKTEGDFFFHRSAVRDDRFGDLVMGQTVEFDPQPKGPKGPRAENVRLIE
jgi:CspA family cold shock protein